MKYESGYLLKLCWELHDGKDRGGTQAARDFVRPLYEAAKVTGQETPGTLHGRICRQLRKQGYFK